MITTLMNYKGYVMAGLGFVFLAVCGYAIYLNLSLENTKAIKKGATMINKGIE